MTKERAADILDAMINGVDPATGEILPDDHLCNTPDVLRALYMAKQALVGEAAQSTGAVRRDGRLNAGRAWTENDLRQLILLHRNGTSMGEMCRLLQRRQRGIHKKLVFLGLEQSDE